MRERKRICLFASVGALFLLSSGCVSTRRDIVKIDAHPTAPVINMESELWEHNSFNGTTTLAAYEFWRCREQGDQVVCERLCGAHMEYACPGRAGDRIGD